MKYVLRKIACGAGALLVAASLVAFSRPSYALIVDFSAGAPAGDIGTSTFIDAGTGLTVDGLYLSGGAWNAAHLYRRSDAPNDLGFGVCSPNEMPCPGPGGGGDVNELDNMGDAELIRLMLPAGYSWVSVGVSSVDASERGVLYTDADGLPNSPTAGAIADTTIETYSGGGPVKFDIAIGAAYANAPYLFFEAYDYLNGGASNDNDYLVWRAEIVPTVPEPTTIAMFVLGLAGLGYIRRRRAA